MQSLTLLFLNFSLCVFFHSCPPRFDLTVRLKSHMVVCAGTAPCLRTSFLRASVLCPARAEILQLVFSWGSGEIHLQGFRAWSHPLAFITSCHFGFKVDYWRKLMQNFRFTKSCITAHCFYGKPFYRPPCGGRVLCGTSVHTSLSAAQPSPSQGEHQCSTNHKTLGKLCDSPWEAEFFKHATTVHVRWR